MKKKKKLQSVHGRKESNEKLIRITEERQEDNPENKKELKGGRERLKWKGDKEGQYIHI